MILVVTKRPLEFAVKSFQSMSHHVGYQTGKVLSRGVGALYLGSLPGHPQCPPASLMVATLVDGGRFTSPVGDLSQE